MGAQAAALLDAGGPVGDVPAPTPLPRTTVLHGPSPYDLDRVARGHGGVGLAPTAWDGSQLHSVLPGGVRVVVHRDLRVDCDGPVDGLRDVLALDDDLTALWDACDRVPSLRWVRPEGAGRVLRSPTAWQDLVGALAGTNASYAQTRRMVASVVDGAFPTPAEVLERDLSAWGYRADSLRGCAQRVVAGDVDPERWRSLEVPDAEVLAEVRSLPGFGPFAAAQLLPLLGGRPRPVVRDAWLERQVDVRDYAAMGEWAGTGAWLAVTAHRRGPAA